MPIDEKLKKAQKELFNKNQEAIETEKQEKLHHTSTIRSLNKQQRQSAKDAHKKQEWNKIIKTLENLKGDWSRGYNNDWISCVYTIMALSEELGKAIALSNPIGEIVNKLDLLTGKGLTGLLTGKIPDENTTLSQMVSEGVDNYLYKYPPEMLFPNLAEHAAFTNDNELNLDSLREMKSTNGTPMFQLKQKPEVKQKPKEAKKDPKEDPKKAKKDPEEEKKEREGGWLLDDQGRPMLEDAYANIHDNLEKALKTIVVAWLGERGYTATTTKPNKFYDTNGAELNKARFDALRDDPQEGLSHYLEDKLDQQLNPITALRP